MDVDRTSYALRSVFFWRSIMLHNREPAVAGMFYPADPATLVKDIKAYLKTGCQKAIANDGTICRAIIAPHAGYMYSGPIAGSAYANVLPIADRVRRVLLLGPAHRVAFAGLALPEVDTFTTPLGAVAIDRGMCNQLISSITCVHEYEGAHDGEHSLEVHLPFLQHILDPSFQLLPMVVGDAGVMDVASVISFCLAHWGDPSEMLIVISSDLSHFENYDTANAIDHETADAITQQQIEVLSGQRACGYIAIGGMLSIASQRRMQVRLLDIRNSGDTAGPKDRVVGYGAFAITES